jgi:hypothetical protein
MNDEVIKYAIETLSYAEMYRAIVGNHFTSAGLAFSFVR